MNPVMLLLELMLAALLVVTLLFGWRLERKLRALRDSQAGFVRAMQDLDGAAQRTEAGLEKLRQATDEARTALTPRIEAARVAADRLEGLTGEAEIAAKRAENAAREVEASAAKLARAIAGPRPALGSDGAGFAQSESSPARRRDALTANPEVEPRLEPHTPSRRETTPADAQPDRRPEPRSEPRLEFKRTAADFAAMLAAKTTRQPLPAQSPESRDFEPRGETRPSGSRLREAAALLRGG